MADPVTDTALASTAAKGAADAGEGAAAAGAGGDFLGGLGSFFGDLFGGGAAADAVGGAGDAIGAAASGLGDVIGAGTPWAFDPGFAAGDLAYLGAGDAASLGGAGADALAGGLADGGSGAADALAGGGGADLANSAFDASNLFGTAGGNAAADFSGGVNSFGSPGVSSFADTMASGGGGGITQLQLDPSAGFAGATDAFTPGAGITAPDAASIDPTSALATGEATTPANATPTMGTTPADLSGLDAAQSSVANEYGAVTANSVPTAPGDAASAATSAGTTPAAAGTTPAAAATPSGGKSFLGMKIGEPTLMGSAGALLSGGLLAKNLLTNTVPGQDQVNAINSTIPQIQSTIDSVNQTAAQLRASTQPLTADAQEMMSYVSKGTLTPAMQAQVQAGVQAAKAQAASIMAQHGLSADPTRNAQLKQQFDTIDSQALQLQGTLANQLYQSGLQAISAANQTQSVAANLQATGLNAVGLTNNTYLALQKIYADQDKNQQAAIANFAGALGKITGGGGGTTIQIGGTKA